jgi:hypothetical protein
MKSTNTYLIPFIGLKIGKHHFEYEIEKKFFDVFGFDEFENCTIHIAVVLEKKSTIFCFLGHGLKKTSFFFVKPLLKKNKIGRLKAAFKK